MRQCGVGRITGGCPGADQRPGGRRGREQGGRTRTRPDQTGRIDKRRHRASRRTRSLGAARPHPASEVENGFAVLSTRIAVLLLVGFGVAGLSVSGSPSRSAAGATVTFTVQGSNKLPPPPPGLVDLDNPSRAAIIRHDIDATLEPAEGKLHATDRITIVHRTADVPGDRAFPFLLWNDLRVLSVAADEASLRYEEREGMKPRSFWRRPPYDELGGYEAARQIDLRLDGSGATWPETLDVTVEYEGVIADSLHPPAAAYARSFDTTSGLICDRGVYLASSSFWIPTRPDDMFTFDLQVEVPVGWLAVSQGAMAESIDRDDRHLVRWSCPHPMEEAYLVAGPWQEHHLRRGDVLAQTFTYADTDSSIYNRYLRGTGRYLDLYGGLIGPYPFAKFALVENFWQTGFGMPSFTLLGNRVIRLPFILDTSYGHEILHNWWGNSVFVASDQGNWCEGLTTYGADYLYKEREGPAAAREYRLNALKNYLDYVGAGEDMPLERFRERHNFATQAIGYSKSMMVIHQLRREVGEDRFWEALQDFYKTNLWRRASWTDLFRSFQRVAGIDPEAWRAEWIERTGAPEITLVRAERTGSGDAWRVEVGIRQQLPDSAAGAAPFRVRVPVRVSGRDGQTQEQEVLLDGWKAEASIPCGFEPARVEVDPDFEVLRRLDRAEIPPSLSETLGADTVTVVIGADLPPEIAGAYRELAKTWAGEQPMAVVEEAQLPPGWTPPTSAWFLGIGPMARSLLNGLPGLSVPDEIGVGATGEWRIEGEPYDAGASVVLTGRFSGREDAAWTVLSVPAAPDVATIGNKVPHYGKYSYLVFDGSTNVGKGVWTQADSPLRRQF